MMTIVQLPMYIRLYHVQ